MSDGMRRELAYLSSHATNRYFIPNWGRFSPCRRRRICHWLLQSHIIWTILPRWCMDTIRAQGSRNTISSYRLYPDYPRSWQRDEQRLGNHQWWGRELAQKRLLRRWVQMQICHHESRIDKHMATSIYAILRRPFYHICRKGLLFCAHYRLQKMSL